MKFQNRAVTDIVPSFGRSVVDSFIESAYWTDLDQLLTDDELDQLTQFLAENGTLDEMWLDYKTMLAENLYEGDYVY